MRVEPHACVCVCVRVCKFVCVWNPMCGNHKVQAVTERCDRQGRWGGEPSGSKQPPKSEAHKASGTGSHRGPNGHWKMRHTVPVGREAIGVQAATEKCDRQGKFLRATNLMQYMRCNLLGAIYMVVYAMQFMCCNLCRKFYMGQRM